MINIDYTQEGGLPVDQATLDFMQKAYYEGINAMLSHFIANPAMNYIISGCEVSGNTITSGWVIMGGELLYFAGAAGNASTKLKASTTTTPLTFQNGIVHDIYTFKQLVIDNTGIALNTFIRIPNANDFLTSMPNATESQRGIAEIATQAEANSDTEDTRIITAKKLYDRTATENRRGVAEIATQSEANSDTEDTRIITAKKLSDRTATESRRGVAEVATQAETNEGIDDTRMITPKKFVQGFDDRLKMITGRVGNSGSRDYYFGTINNAGGYPFSVTVTSNGQFNIYHNLGHTNYSVVASSRVNGISCTVTNITSEYFTVRSYNQSGISQVGFSFILKFS